MLKLLQKVLQKYFACFFLLAIFIASTYYLYQPGIFYVHDFTIGAKIVEMSNSLKSWQFPVRWSANLGYGFGMPLFNFYAPLPYFLGALFYLISGQLVLTIKFLYLFLTLITLVGSYKLGKKLFGFWGGLLLAATFTLAPYRAVNLFVRGALSEVFAMSFFPWVILAIERIRDRKNNQIDLSAIILLFISLLAIILSHNLSALIFIPFASLWALYRLTNKVFWDTSLTFILAFLTSAFYTLPSFLEKNLAQVNKIFTGYFDYHLHFLYIRQFFQSAWAYGGSTWGPEDDISFFLGWGQLAALIVTSILLFIKLIDIIQKKSWQKFFKERKTQLLLLSLFLALFSTFLTLEKSLCLWDKISLFSYIQFPWRFLSTSAFFLAIYLTAGITHLSKTTKPILISSLVLLTLLNAQFFRAEKILDQADNYYYADQNQLSTKMSQTLPDYIPIQMAEEEILQNYNQLYPGASIWPLEDSSDNFIISSQILTKRNHSQTWQINMSEAAIVNFKIANFSGWKATVDQEPIEIINNKDLGNIQLPIPAGEHQVKVYFAENNLRIISDLISLISLMTFIGLIVILKRKQTNH